MKERRVACAKEKKIFRDAGTKREARPKAEENKRRLGENENVCVARRLEQAKRKISNSESKHRNETRRTENSFEQSKSKRN